MAALPPLRSVNRHNCLLSSSSTCLSHQGWYRTSSPFLFATFCHIVPETLGFGHSLRNAGNDEFEWVARASPANTGRSRCRATHRAPLRVSRPCGLPSFPRCARLTPPAPLCDPGLRALLARFCRHGRVGRSCCSLHRITAFSPSRAARASTLAALWPSAPPDCLRCAVLATVPGNSARATGARSCRNFPFPRSMPR